MADEETDSLQLVTRIQLGETHLFDVLYARYFDVLYGYLTSLVRPDEVEDVLQRLFLRLLRVLPRFDVQQSSSFRAWLFRVARNEALDHRAERDHAQSLAPEDLRRAMENRADRIGPGVELDWIPDAVLASALRALSATQREVIVLRYAADLPLTEVATILGITERAAWNHHHRALAALEKRMAPRRPDPTQRRTLPMRRLANTARHVMVQSFPPTRV